MGARESSDFEQRLECLEKQMAALLSDAASAFSVDRKFRRLDQALGEMKVTLEELKRGNSR